MQRPGRLQAAAGPLGAVPRSASMLATAVPRRAAAMRTAVPPNVADSRPIVMYQGRNEMTSMMLKGSIANLSLSGALNSLRGLGARGGVRGVRGGGKGGGGGEAAGINGACMGACARPPLQPALPATLRPHRHHLRK